MALIINTRNDLESLKGGEDYATALKIILGSTTTWINRGTDVMPNWQQESVLEQMRELGFETLGELLAECAAAGVVPPDSQPPPVVVLPPPAVVDMDVEAQRRIIALTGVRDAMHLAMYLSDRSRSVIRLLLKGKTKWTAVDMAAVAKYEQLDEEIEAILAAGNVMKPNLPADFADDKNWPAVG